MDLSIELNINSQAVQKHIDKILKTFYTEVEKINPKLLPLVDEFIKASKGGKKVRSFLIGLGYKLAGGKKNDWVLDVAAAYEIFHTAILAHDDIIDQSLLRRGQPSLYKALHLKDGRVGGEHYGISQAISLADCAFFIAFKTITESKIPDKQKLEVLNYFSKTVIQTGVGEMLDVELSSKKKTEEKDIFKIMELKTAYYTIVAPLQMGAILAKADKTFLKKLADFGYNLGIAFQIQDDILGSFGEEKKTGKSNLSDIEEGKMTLLLSFVLEKSLLKQKNALNNLYGKKRIKISEAEIVKQIFIQTGALDYCQKKALEYVNLAKKRAKLLTKKPDLQVLLTKIVEYMVERTA